mgnify:CR=1 FL=1
MYNLHENNFSKLYTSKMIQINDLTKLFSNTENYSTFIKEFLELFEITKKKFPNTLLITSISNQDNNCNFAIDTSNSYTQDTKIKNEYKTIVLNFIEKYITAWNKEELLKFFNYSSDTINISCNILENSLNFNLCYTWSFLNNETTNFIMQKYVPNFLTHAGKNFVCLNVWAHSINSLKHYSIQVSNINKIPKKYSVLLPFSKISDTFMLLSRYKKEDISQKMYVNVYNFSLYSTPRITRFLNHLWIPSYVNNTLKNTRIGCIASKWWSHLEVYYILNE